MYKLARVQRVKMLIYNLLIFQSLSVIYLKLKLVHDMDISIFGIFVVSKHIW